MNIYGQAQESEEKALQNSAKTAKLDTKNGLIVCPNCGRLTSQAVRPDTEARNLVLWCRRCKASNIVDIEHGACSLSSHC